MVPIVADAEAGFGGPLNAYELMSAMIAAGAAGVHWEDQLASEKKCGHLGGKVLVPTAQHIRTLNAARLAADVSGTSSVIIARTDSLAADTPSGRIWHRFTFDGYGEQADGGAWDIFEAKSAQTLGRARR